VPSSAKPGTGLAWCRFRTSSQSRSSSLPSVPQMPASGSEVVGRRAAAVAMSSPLTALNRDDLPLPVAPKNPTTVWSPDRERGLLDQPRPKTANLPPSIPHQTTTHQSRAPWNIWASSQSRRPISQAWPSGWFRM